MPSSENKSPKDIVVVGASAGGVEALRVMLSYLSPSIGASIFIVLHLPSNSRSMLATILGNELPFEVVVPTDGMPIEPSKIYVAPPGVHLTLTTTHIRLSHGPKVNGVRPAIDPLFRSAAYVFGSRVIAVVLTGTLDDGTAGIVSVKRKGGVTVAQDPIEATFSEMPERAIESGAVDHILPLDEIAELINASGAMKTSEEPTNPNQPERSPSHREPQSPDWDRKIAEDILAQEEGEPEGHSTVLTCPECGGVMWETDESGLIRFQCHVGHAYTVDNFHEAQEARVEAALWSAVRLLTEKAALNRKLISRLEASGSSHRSLERFEQQALDAERDAAVLRQILLKGTV